MIKITRVSFLAYKAHLAGVISNLSMCRCVLSDAARCYSGCGSYACHSGHFHLSTGSAADNVSELPPVYPHSDHVRVGTHGLDACPRSLPCRVRVVITPWRRSYVIVAVCLSVCHSLCSYDLLAITNNEVLHGLAVSDATFKPPPLKRRLYAMAMAMSNA